MTTRTDDLDEIDVLPAGEIHVGNGGGSERPVLLAIPIYGRNGRGGAAHGVQLTRDGALVLARDLAEVLGLSLRSARLKKVWGVPLWPRTRIAVQQSEHDLRRVQAAPCSSEAPMQPAIGDQVAAQDTSRIPAQRTAAVGLQCDGDTEVSGPALHNRGE